MNIQLARLLVNIQEGLTDQYDYDFLLQWLEELIDASEMDIEVYVQNNYEEIINWKP